jgi:Amidohydrolase family
MTNTKLRHCHGCAFVRLHMRAQSSTDTTRCHGGKVVIEGSDVEQQRWCHEVLSSDHLTIITASTLTRMSATTASATTPGLVCGHHHLYSSLARGMPAPPKQPTSFGSILEQVWWRLDCALDLEMIKWSAMLGALEALESGTTTIIDHHESPNAIEGSLDVIAQACETVGVRVIAAYGVTDRHAGSGAVPIEKQPSVTNRPRKMTDAARRGLVENERFIKAGGRGMIGVHAAFTCADETLEAAADLAQRLNVGVHIHVAEGPDDMAAGARLENLSTDDWLLVHCVHLDRELRGTIAHNARSNMNNAVGYAYPARRPNQIILGTDGIGANMLEEFRLSYVRLRESDVAQSPDTPWKWLTNGWNLAPEAKADTVTWNYDPVEAWHIAFTTGIQAQRVTRSDGTLLLDNGIAQLVDAPEVRAKAKEQSARLFSHL